MPETDTETAHRFDVMLYVGTNYNGAIHGCDSYHGCWIRETPNYLEITPNQGDLTTRHLYPWGIIHRATFTELPD